MRVTALLLHLEREEQIGQRYLAITNASLAAAPAGLCEWKDTRQHRCGCHLCGHRAPSRLGALAWRGALPGFLPLSVRLLHHLDLSYSSFDWQRYKQGRARNAPPSLTLKPQSESLLGEEKKTQLVEISLKDLVSGFIAREWTIKTQLLLGRGTLMCGVYDRVCVDVCLWEFTVKILPRSKNSFGKIHIDSLSPMFCGAI